MNEKGEYITFYKHTHHAKFLHIAYFVITYYCSFKIVLYFV